MSVKETIERAILAVGEAQSGMEHKIAEKMFRASLKLAKSQGFNVGFIMNPTGKIEAHLLPFEPSAVSPAAYADGWTLTPWDEAFLAEFNIKWAA